MIHNSINPKCEMNNSTRLSTNESTESFESKKYNNYDERCKLYLFSYDA